MPREATEQLLLQAVQRKPGMMWDLLKMQSEAGGGGAPEPPHHENATPHWCVCGHCRDMPTVLEEKCCEIQNCLSLSPVSFHKIEKEK